MIAKKIPRLTFLLACLFHTPAVAGFSDCTYYVDPAGDDTATGASEAPWLTLQHAADTVQAGDTVCIQSGQYAGFRATVSGTAGNVITFKAEENGLVTVNSAGPNNLFDYIELEADGLSYWTIEGIHITGSSRYGVSVFGASDNKASNITLREVLVTNSNKSGMYLEFVDNALVEDCVVGENGYNGIHFKADGDNETIQDNILYNNHGGIQVNGAADFGGDGMMSNSLISNNLLFGNNYDGTGGAIGLDGVDTSTISGNNLFDNEYIGIDIYLMDGGGPNTDNVFADNIISMPAGSDWAVRIACLTCTGNSFTGNSIYHADQGVGSIKIPKSNLSLTSDNNLLSDRFSVNGGSTLIDLSTWQGYGFDTSSSLLTSPPSSTIACTRPDGTYTYELFETDGNYWGYGTITFADGEMTERSFTSGCGELDIDTITTTINSNTCRHTIEHTARCSGTTGDYKTYNWYLVPSSEGYEFSGTADVIPAGATQPATSWIVFGMKEKSSTTTTANTAFLPAIYSLLLLNN